jgi:hypothetical protein
VAIFIQGGKKEFFCGENGWQGGAPHAHQLNDVMTHDAVSQKSGDSKVTTAGIEQ